MTFHAFNTDSELIDAIGGTATVARLMDLKNPAVSNWRIYGIPYDALRFLARDFPQFFPRPLPDRKTWRKSRRRVHRPVVRLGMMRSAA